MPLPTSPTFPLPNPRRIRNCQEQREKDFLLLQLPIYTWLLTGVRVRLNFKSSSKFCLWHWNRHNNTIRNDHGTFCCLRILKRVLTLYDFNFILNRVRNSPIEYLCSGGHKQRCFLIVFHIQSINYIVPNIVSYLYIFNKFTY
uniref:Uncharacterized protein n=1 Tax=Rousettus aegyptiacus TaxID=9407 RepID=A0A7J8F188_ROUAE|nr:hypothetical protein HJG63_012319 [Rousettus aegyptiacus]